MTADSTKCWTLVPRDRLVLRDGRTDGAAGNVMRTLPFPWPSSVAGMVRSRIGLEADGSFSLTAQEARGIDVAGPWLLRRAGGAECWEWMAPAPRDVLWYQAVERDQQACRPRAVRLVPTPLREGEFTDLDASLGVLQPAETLPEDREGCRGPAFWTGESLLRWLTEAPSALGGDRLPRGSARPPVERRTHVQIDPTRGTAADGTLFTTEGLRFAAGPGTVTEHGNGEPGAAGEPARFALGFRCTDERLRAGIVQLGGERQLSELGREDTEVPTFPESFPESAELLRVVLLTPAIFDHDRASGTVHAGAVPGEIAGAEVVAAAVDRPEPLSGWDFDRGTPKPTRHMAPAGSVYWVRPPADRSPRAWARAVWMTCVSSQEQDRRDGFGLALVGVS